MGKVVDMILTDPPYDITNNFWDEELDLDEMWDNFHKIIKPDGNIVIFSAQPFTSKLIMSNLEEFKYEIIWKKTIGSGQLNINRRPLRIHENVCVFYKRFGTYNEQLGEGKPYKINRKNSKYNTNYNKQKDHISINKGIRRPQTVVEIANPRIKGQHPTQKPVELLEYLIKTYSNPGDLIYDPFEGSGSTGIAAHNLGREYKGYDKYNG